MTKFKVALTVENGKMNLSKMLTKERIRELKREFNL